MRTREARRELLIDVHRLKKIGRDPHYSAVEMKTTTISNILINYPQLIQIEITLICNCKLEPTACTATQIAPTITLLLLIVKLPLGAIQSRHAVLHVCR